MSIKPFFIPAALLCNVLLVTPNFAQTTTSLPDCQSVESDSDGDGFGFENDQSCIVVGGQAMQAQIGQCVDTDGDGFGWNGVATCDPTESGDETTIELPNCVSAESDSDNDGFGFENNQSCIVVGFQTQVGQCIDTDGDGFGWNGVETCDPLGSAFVSHEITFPSPDTFPDLPPTQSRPFPVLLEDFSDQFWACLDYFSSGRPVPFSLETWTFNADGSGDRNMQFNRVVNQFSWVWTSDGALITWLDPELHDVSPTFLFFVNNLPESSYWVRGGIVSRVSRSGPFQGGLGCSNERI